MTLVDAALALGVAKQTLSDLETAKSSVGLATALHVAREMGVTLFAVPAAEREIVRRAIAQARIEMPGASTESGGRKS
jgi:DNA-binding XRE family transcriptional regulator